MDIQTVAETGFLGCQSQGSPEHLLAEGGFYADMLNLQCGA